MRILGTILGGFGLAAAVILALPSQALADHWGWRGGYYYGGYPYGYYPYAYPYAYPYPPNYGYVQPPAVVIQQQPPAVYAVPPPPPSPAQAGPTAAPSGMFKNAQGQNCVNFQSSVPAGNQMQIVNGIACQQANGTWATVAK